MKGIDDGLETVPGLVFNALLPASVGDLPRPAGGAGALPVADVMPRTRGAGIWMATATVDSDGRFSARAVLRHLGWTTGRVTVTVDPASGTLTITPGGMQVVTARGMVRLPVAVRRACEIGTGDRLLLVVGPGRGALSAFTSYAVQRWIEIGHEKQAVGVR